MTVYSDLTQKTGNELIDSILSDQHFRLKSDRTIYWSRTIPNWPNDPYVSKQLDGAMLAQVQYAMARYSEVANINFREIASSTETELSITSAENLYSIGAAGIAVMNNGAPFATVQLQISQQNEYDWITAAHEIGHILGLSHTKELINGVYQTNPTSKKYSFIDTVMSYNGQSSYPFDEKYRTMLYKNWEFLGHAKLKNLSINDIAAIQYLYGANYNYNSDNTTYIYDPSTLNFYDTIWDGGGTDTIDLSRFSLGTDLNLTNGTRSSVYIPVNRNDGDITRMYNGTSAIGIAYGANIENARGTQGNDTITGNELNNTIWGESGNDIIYGNDGNDLLYGGTGNDTLYGGAGNDTLDGGTGSDTMFGGAGNDIYYVDSAGDTVTENSNEGIDTVNSSVSFTLASNIENLTLAGSSSINGFGNNLNNIILGNGYDNVLFGNSGNDVMQGFGGRDTLYGGDGNDTLYGDAGGDLLYGGNGNDQYNIFDASASIIEYQSEGIDTITICSDSILSHKMTENLENFYSPSLGNNISIVGNDLSNSIRIGGGNNVITGGKGDDILSGGGGNDTYIFNRGDGSDRIQEAGKDVASSKTDVDVLQFGEGINFDQLWFSKESFYGTLTVGLIGTTDKVSIEFWYPNQQTNWSENYIEKFQTSDGKTLSLGKVDQLVNAMAAFSPPALGQTTLPSNYQQTLAPVIAAAWS
ncbi:M12 family metallo-peptidase [Pseudomonas sp. GD04087]|uniref:M12 family metallo-peptidase n=1 Tax=unclassified Pseudomonas TaxID=196821 RepID=UPI0024485024|nr:MULTISPECIES: M12 family metallo-peptidase [unclassified Pseudomonas]MDH0292548.1 M12 family metallo-peptidase [Pseudomonas sp. GD04087]MDH1052771.1 M12 family metallo-peptidase [Pseudomonas sp. GD03903]MDH2001669.1 M12 family metallo-peptidase [Pseudomonas sp. GD03691]